MKFKIIFLSAILILQNNLFSQNSFDRLIQTVQDEEIINVIENHSSNFVAVGIRYYNSYKERVGLIVMVNNEGEILMEKEIKIKDSLLGFGNIYQKNNHNYLCIGSISDTTNNQYNLYLCELDPNLNLIKSKQYQIGENITPSIEGILENFSNNIVLYGSVHETFPLLNMLFFELSQNLDSINMHIDITATADLSSVLSLIEKKDNSGYYALSPYYDDTDLTVVNTDENFNVISYKEVPDVTHHYGNLKWFSDSTYIITGRKTHPNKYQDDDISCMILDTTQHTILHQNYFGAVDTSDIPGRITSIDFIDKNNIYIAGTHVYYYENPNPPSAPVYDNYIFVNKTDSLLNTKHEIFYGGDMGYYVWSVKATIDGGCIIVASRYDYKAQTYERDGLLLKLDADGNLPTSIKEPKIQAHELILYPNPGSTQLNIRTAFQRIGGEFRMYDISGKLVFQKHIIESITNINTEQLSSGVYIYNYMHKAGMIENGKWVKE